MAYLLIQMENQWTKYYKRWTFYWAWGICRDSWIWKDRLKEDANATLIIDDDYEITDYDVKVYHHSGNCTLDYRKWMYNKFGDEYARDYLFNG